MIYPQEASTCLGVAPGPEPMIYSVDISVLSEETEQIYVFEATTLHQTQLACEYGTLVTK